MKVTEKRIGQLVMVLLVSVSALAQKAPPDTAQKIVPGRINSVSQQDKPYVILISADGFRYDYRFKYEAKNLQRLSKKGLQAPYMIPSFPSLTFPNHYTLATGLYPAHHGLVNNSFYDPAAARRYSMSDKKEVYDPYWYGGTPLWVAAEKQGMLSASFYWVGSEGPIQGVLPTYYYLYNEEISMEDRLLAVKKWLQLPEGERPHLITFYFPEVDHEGHYHGPDAVETKEAVALVDNAIGRLTAMVDSLKLRVNYVFVSDHGMAAVDTVQTVLPPDFDSTQFVRVQGDMMVSYYAKDSAAVPAFYASLKASAGDQYDVYLRTQTPAAWHYGKADDRYNRIGDIFLVARYPKIFAWGNKKVNPGRHGFDPSVVTDMRATFLAWGPDIKYRKMEPIRNVEVYGLVMRLLGLRIMEPVDGSPAIWNRLSVGH